MKLHDKLKFHFHIFDFLHVLYKPIPKLSLQKNIFSPSYSSLKHKKIILIFSLSYERRQK